MSKNRPKAPVAKTLDHRRFCKACGVVADPGPVGYTWDFHIVRDRMGMPTGEMFGSCSPECRAQLELPERKAALAPAPKPAPVEDENQWW